MKTVKLLTIGIIVLAILAGLTGWSAAQVPPISTWSKTYGGGASDLAYAMDKTLDGGFIVAGQTASFGAGGSDAWVLKLKSDGSIDWQMSYGGTADDYATSIKATPDGEYVVAGATGCSGSNYNPCDAWVFKLDSAGGMVWQKKFGGSTRDYATNVVPAIGGGYLVAGVTVLNSSFWDQWVFKLADDGTPVWQKTFRFGGSGDAATCLVAVEGGYVLGGYFFVGSGHAHGFLIKLNLDGDKVWAKTYDFGSREDAIYGLAATSDGGLIAVGSTWSPGSGSYMSGFVLKLDGSGSMVQWKKSYHQSYWVWPNSVMETLDGSYLVGGFTATGTWSGRNGYLLKLATDGALEWQDKYGAETHEDALYSILETDDGGYLAAGFAASYGTGGNQFWVLKLNEEGKIGADCTVSQGATETELSVTVNVAEAVVQNDNPALTFQDILFTAFNTTAQLATQCEEIVYTIAASAGTNGTINPSGSVTVNRGADQAFAVTPSAGYHVADVLVDGASVGAVTSYTFEDVVDDHTITASFAINTFTVTAAVAGDPAGGSVSPSSQPVNHGDTATFTVSINPGYTAAVSEGTLSGNTWTIPNVTSTHTATVTFAGSTELIITNIAASPSALWPPNNKMVNVTVTVGASKPFALNTAAVTTNEPEEDADWIIPDVSGINSGDSLETSFTLPLRAERWGKGTGRIYTIIITVSDAGGSISAPVSVVVTVPHDQGK